MRKLTRAGWLLALTILPVRHLAAQATTPRREGFVSAGEGVRLFYRIVGTGRDTVVVVHGGPGFTMEYLAADLEPLAARHALLFYDQRGAGRSTLVSDSTGLDAHRFADDLEAVRQHFGLGRLTLLAHSWGAAVAALYAIAHPDRVARLIIVDGIPATGAERNRGFKGLDTRRDSATRQRIEELRVARVAKPGDAEACRAYYAVAFAAYYADTVAARRSRGDFCSGTPAALTNKQNVDRYAMSSLGDWDWRSALRGVPARAVVIHGTADFFPVETAREWATALPNARLVLIDGGGHFSYVDRPDRVFAAVEEFLAQR